MQVSANLAADELTSLIADGLISGNGDVGQLFDSIVQTGIHRTDAARIVRSAVREINAALFPPVAKMELFLTEVCNLRCTYCFENGMDRRRSMSTEVAFRAVDLLFDYAGEREELHITFFGGEPCSQFRTIQAVTEYAEDKAAGGGKSLSFGMTSNGTLFTDEMLEFFARKKINILLSIDGMEHSHNQYRRDVGGAGSFHRVMEGMAKLKKYQPWVGARMTVMPDTAQDLYANVRGLYDAGVNHFIIGAATGVAWTEEQIAAYCDNMVKVRDWYKGGTFSDLRISELDEAPHTGTYFGCQAGRDSISVSVDGEISGCSKILALDSRELIAKLGDLESGLSGIQNRMQMVGCEALKRNCEELGVADNFQGGCFACNYEYSGDIYSPDLAAEHFRTRLASTLHQT